MMRLFAGAAAVLLLASSQNDDAPRQISKSGKGAYEASLTVSGKQLAAAWYDTRDGHPEIYFRILDASGRPDGPERRVTNGTDFAYEPDIAALDDAFAIAWYEKNPATSALRAKLTLVSREGRILWGTTLSSAGREGRNPVVRVVKGDVLCAWLEYQAGQSPEVWARWFDAKGRPLAPAQRVAAAGRTTWNLNAAVDSHGRAWLTFDAAAGTRNDELFLARVDKTSSHVVRLSPDDGVASKYPDIAFRGDTAALVWFDEKDGNEEVYLAVSPLAQLADGVERTARRVTDTPGASIGRLTDNASDSLIPAIRPWRDGFALVWNEFVAGKSGGHGDGGKSEVWGAFVRKSDK
jgi:hypothetical protein